MTKKLFALVLSLVMLLSCLTFAAGEGNTAFVPRLDAGEKVTLYFVGSYDNLVLHGKLGDAKKRTSKKK